MRVQIDSHHHAIWDAGSFSISIFNGDRFVDSIIAFGPRRAPSQIAVMSALEHYMQYRSCDDCQYFIDHHPECERVSNANVSAV